MTVPALPLTFVQQLPDRCMRTEEHEAFATGLLGPCTASIRGQMTTGPDLDTQFQLLEVATAAWTRLEPPTPTVSWSTGVERVAGGDTWFAGSTHCELTLTGFADHDAAWATYEAFRVALRPKGYLPLFYGSSRLLQALREADDTVGLQRWQGARAAAILDAGPDRRDAAALDCTQMGLDLIVDIAQRHPTPEAIRILDLRHNRLEALPEALGRFRGVTQLWLHHNALSDGPCPDRLRAMFPELEIVELQGCPLRPGVADALRAAGLRVTT